MLDSFLKFLELGLYHIVSFKGYDHILFLVVLTIPFLFKDWKRLLLLISSFTLGHTLSLLLGVCDRVVDSIYNHYHGSLQCLYRRKIL
jgi:hypothetical protein